MNQGESTLEEIRDKLDNLDDRIQELLNERAALAAAVAAVKGDAAVKIRPAREARILRRLISQQTGPFPKRNLIRIWREIFSAMLSLEGSFSVAAYQTADNPTYWDLARDQFGSFTPIMPHQTPRRVIDAVMRNEATLGVLPAPGEAPPDESDWWRGLAIGPSAVPDQTLPRVVAKLPFAGAGNARSQGLQAMVIARLELEASGDDHSWLALEVTNDLSMERLRGRFSSAGLEGHFLDKQRDAGPPNRWLHLFDAAGFIVPEDPRLTDLANALDEEFSQLWVIGGYAAPFAAERLADAPVHAGNGKQRAAS